MKILKYTNCFDYYMDTKMNEWMDEYAYINI